MTNHNDSKQCTKCQRILSIDEFYRQKKSRDGYQSHCKDCDRVRRSAYYAANRDRILSKRREYHQQNRDKNIEYLRRWRADNLERSREGAKEYSRRNRDKVLAYQKQYRAENKKAIAEYQQQYRQSERGKVIRNSLEHKRRSKANASGTHTASDIAAIRAAQTDRKGRLRCWWCSAVITDYHVDHKIPLSRGGGNGADNLCLACPTCNLRKHAQTPAEFAGRLI